MHRYSRLTCLFTLLFFSSVGLADERYIIKLKNGDIVRGEVFRFDQDKWIDIRLQDGTERHIVNPEIESAIREGEETEPVAATPPVAEKAAGEPAPETPPPAPEKKFVIDPSLQNYAGAMGGLAFGTSSGAGTHLTYSVRGGRNIFADTTAEIPVSLLIGRLSDSTTSSGITIATSITVVMIELIGRHAWHTGLYFGGRFGLGFVNATFSTSGISLSGSSTGFAMGPVVGWELPIGTQTSLMFDASWVSVAGSDMTLPVLGALKVNSTSAVVLQAGAMIHF